MDPKKNPADFDSIHFIKQMLAELVEMGKENQLDMTVYLLGMALADLNEVENSMRVEICQQNVEKSDHIKKFIDSASKSSVH